MGDKPLYFEARNLIRNRAHEDALGQFANYLLGQKKVALEQAVSKTDRMKLREDIQLLEATVAFYQMDDLKKVRSMNLYQKVGDILKSRNDRKDQNE